jgi:hypothetical protein
MNSLHSKLRFEFIQDSTRASFLDLAISKGTRFKTEGRFDLEVHQKSMNLYLYIPFNSYHTDAAKRSFIQTELTRYIRNSSSIESYLSLKELFFTRLRDRGYPIHFLLPIFNNIHYSDRAFFLLPSLELLDSPLRLIRSPTSLCLLKRIARTERMIGTVPDTDTITRPAIFIIPFTPLSKTMNTRQILMKAWSLIGRTNTSGGLTPPIIAYQSYPSIMMSLIYQKARRMNEFRKETFTLNTLKQSTLNLNITNHIH